MRFKDTVAPSKARTCTYTCAQQHQLITQIITVITKRFRLYRIFFLYLKCATRTYRQ